MNKKSKKRLERVDRAIEFDFDEVSPTDDPYVPQEPGEAEIRRANMEVRMARSSSRSLGSRSQRSVFALR